MSGKADYNPSGIGVKGTIFGLPFKEAESSVIILPIPWDATVSYSSGTADGPQAILDASCQLDLEIAGVEAPWKKGIWMAPIDQEVRSTSNNLRKKVAPYLAQLEQGTRHPVDDRIIETVNQGTDRLRGMIKSQALKYLNQDKVVGLLGGDHSCPLGYLEALSEYHDDFGVLQIDAHMDLRRAYESFTHSHASIMYNALQLSGVSKLVQVGIRDYCEEELVRADADDRVDVYYDNHLKEQLFEGVTWQTICDGMVSSLPQKVYISFDIDGLESSLCPGTGTPVPGGLSYAEVNYLIRAVKLSGRKIIGFDLCEVAPQSGDQEWNANVGARVLYALCSVV